MRRTLFIGIAVWLALFVGCRSAYGAQEEFWQAKKSLHFCVYYKTLSLSDYADELLKYAEQYYTSITEEFGFRRFNFWTWEKACKIYLYPTRQDYLSATQQPGWSGGTAYLREKTIRTFPYKQGYFETNFPHEIAHLIFREFVGMSASIPLWLDEGIACLQEKESRKDYLRVAQVLVRSSVFIPFEKLASIKEEGLIMEDIFYAESASIIQFLLEDFGKDNFMDFCRRLRDRENWKNALTEVYGFKDLAEMNKRWLDFLLQKKSG